MSSLSQYFSPCGCGLCQPVSSANCSLIFSLDSAVQCLGACPIVKKTKPKASSAKNKNKRLCPGPYTTSPGSRGVLRNPCDLCSMLLCLCAPPAQAVLRFPFRAVSKGLPFFSFLFCFSLEQQWEAPAAAASSNLFQLSEAQAAMAAPAAASI